MFRLICLVLSLTIPVSCTPLTNGQVQPTAAERLKTALDLTTCATSDVLPGVAETVRALLGDASAAEKALAGIVGAGGAVAKAYGCYLLTKATVKTQAGEGGEISAAQQPPEAVIKARADLCSLGGRCPRDEHAAAYVLQRLLDQGRVQIAPAAEVR